jgi:hypothetical protein
MILRTDAGKESGRCFTLVAATNSDEFRDASSETDSVEL